MTDLINEIPGGNISSPKGFSAGATFAGLKTFAEDKLDLGLIVSEEQCAAAGVFTTSAIRSPSVDVTTEYIQNGAARCIFVNAGIANACVGEQGFLDAREISKQVAEKIQCSDEDVLVCSTGVIGVELPMSLISSGLEKVELLDSSGPDVARAMMTTDTRPKEIAITLELGGKTVTIGGVAKGSGMIHPNMATMLSFITTDASVDKEFLHDVIKNVCDDTYNMLSVDGDTSTNDTVLILANGVAGNTEINAKSSDAADFIEGVRYVCTDLVRKLARDGEGASTLITVDVCGAKSKQDARKAAKTVVASNLVKSAVYGADPNWGRILMALGMSDVEVNEQSIDLFINGVCIMESGKSIPYFKDAVVALMQEPEVNFRLQLNLGEFDATAWGCDLTEQYVIINSAYTN